MKFSKRNRSSPFGNIKCSSRISIFLSMTLTVMLVTAAHRRKPSVISDYQPFVKCGSKNCQRLQTYEKLSRDYGTTKTSNVASKLASLQFQTPRDSNLVLDIPLECRLWRKIARKPSLLHLYRKHFNSHDVADWFLYASIFGEDWHRSQHKRPRYLDIAANHARRWSTTWFFDRCLGWDGVCAEPNNIYWEELKTERHCKLIKSCLSDRQRHVNFSYTEAFGGVVADESSNDSSGRMGVNGSKHSKEKKFSKHFHGIREVVCETLQHGLSDLYGKGEKHFDFMTLDVEGHEFPILQGIDWKKTTIDVIITENRSPLVVQFLSDKQYKHYSHVHKDDIWIRYGSNINLDSSVVTWMNLLNRTTLKFQKSAVDDATDFTS